jgi:hypothetical protein
MFIVLCSRIMIRYASIGAILMSQRVADGIRDHSGLWKHGHTYQACPFLIQSVVIYALYLNRHILWLVLPP